MDLVAAFKELGVDDPEGWASSQTNEGIDQLARATALRALSDIAAGAPTILAGMDQSGATAEVRASAKRLQAADVDQEDMDLVVKAVVSDLMFNVCALLDGAAEPTVNPGGEMLGAFSVKEVGGDFIPVGEGLGLHEDWNEFAANALGEDVVIK